MEAINFAQYFANIKIVLVETTHPGNIGATARAIKTMGLSRLVLVNPARFPDVGATARASGADDVLFSAEVVPDLATALADCRLVIGASARQRDIMSPEINPRQCAERILNISRRGETALVFGRESSGLSNDELDHCHFTVRIPANPEYNSLNLAAAVQVLAYELRMSAGLTEDLPPTELEPAPNEELERFYQHLQSVLLDLGFLNPDNPRHLMRRLRRLFNRTQPEQKEIQILRGILSAIEDHQARTDNT